MCRRGMVWWHAGGCASGGVVQRVDNPLKRAQALIQSKSENGETPTLVAVMEELTKPPKPSGGDGGDQLAQRGGWSGQR